MEGTMSQERPMTDRACKRSRDAYRRWLLRLEEMCDAYRKLEAAIGTGREVTLRREFQHLTRRVDAVTLPPPWKSWQQLGAAIHGRAYRPKTR